MKAGFTSHFFGERGAPAGGVTFGNGFTISWQRGAPLTESGRLEPNGAFVEDVIGAALDRIKYFQEESGFPCDENAEAIAHLQAALDALAARTNRLNDKGE